MAEMQGNLFDDANQAKKDASKRGNGKRWEGHQKTYIKCEVCDKEFRVVPSLVGITRVCSWVCRRKLQQQKFPDRTCKGCGKSFRGKSHHGSRTYCSPECLRKNKKGNGRVRNGPQTPMACEECGKTFKVWPGAINRRHYCSRQCREAARIKAGQRICKFCGKQFHSPMAEKRKGHGNYCSRECFFISIMSIQAQVRIRGKCERCGWNAEPGILVIHHKDRDRTNNTLENLELLDPLCHALEHFYAKDGPYAQNGANTKRKQRTMERLRKAIAKHPELMALLGVLCED